MKNIAFIFPGQGSQSFGMGQDFFASSDLAKDMFAKASARLNVDFEKLLFEKNDKLGDTKYTQPAILLVSAIALELFKKKYNISPKFFLGHSLGEFSALYASGSIDFLDALELVHKRGQFMSEACLNKNAGMMAVLGLDDESIEKLCLKAREENKQIWTANFNTDGQVVLAGSKKDLEDFSANFIEGGAKKAIVLDMNVASHCELLEPAIPKLEPLLQKFVKDSFNAPIVSNVSTEEYSSKEKAITLLTKQLISPVKYKQAILKYANNVDLFIEFGNSLVLKGLNRKITKTPTFNVSDMKTLEKIGEKINE